MNLFVDFNTSNIFVYICIILCTLYVYRFLKTRTCIGNQTFYNTSKIEL